MPSSRLEPAERFQAPRPARGRQRPRSWTEGHLAALTAQLPPTTDRDRGLVEVTPTSGATPRRSIREASATLALGGTRPKPPDGRGNDDAGLDVGGAARYLMNMEQWLTARLAELAAAGLLREPVDSELHLSAAAGRPWLDACSNDYLGLGAYPVSRETMDSAFGTVIGSRASRLVQGTYPEHQALEAELAAWVGTEACLTTTSAFAANVGVIPALANADSLIVSDALNHASIVDGCRLARAPVAVTPHLDLTAVEAALRQHRGKAPAWVITEGLFSMDGDSPNLAELRPLCDRYGAGLLVDEAHSLGVLGPGGAGLAADQGITPDVLVAGLGKAVGSQGGMIASTGQMRTWLWNRARSFVFSTAPSPVLCRLTLAQVRATRLADAQRARLAQLSAALRGELTARGFNLIPSAGGPIVAVVLGSNARAVDAMNGLRSRGILVQAIRPPSVPAGAARLRLTVHADWGDDAVERIALGLEEVCGS